MTAEGLRGDAKRLIDAIAAGPRFAGSISEGEARRFCAENLRASGLAVTETEFGFSEWPGRWGIPLVTGWLLAAILLMALVASLDTPLHGVVAGQCVIVAGSLLARSRRRSATAGMKWLRSRSFNLEASRGSPRVWLVAHLDSKSQSIPMLLRVASHVALSTVFAVAVVGGFLSEFGIWRGPSWGLIALAASLAALPSLFCFVGNESDGALDNATGVAAVLLAARLVPSGAAFGVLITSGEELDLAGARAWGKGPGSSAVMVNCDTVDDDGGWRCMYRNRPHAATVAAGNAAKKLGLRLRMGGMIPGIITDSLAFESAGLPAVTLSRGALRTLARLHTRGDDSGRVSGAGAATAARLLAQMVEELA